ncbi:hypothetical protein DLAC_05566 [Tieghemostelium lacteum]|uniref:Uncharacterized protein n=1 Tax=Tieghemostelium lacteum TaxID=361077 RepID=A0A151ZGA9_TIELA|nr:hypothetical protein DLAC_05566 [Tieghemostelium lacteum]|eukprot:KYQ92965.1 hypothetical protein DLAC_05566 [Tieghemostelium lacteum]
MTLLKTISALGNPTKSVTNASLSSGPILSSGQSNEKSASWCPYGGRGGDTYNTIVYADIDINIYGNVNVYSGYGRGGGCY